MVYDMERERVLGHSVEVWVHRAYKKLASGSRNLPILYLI